MLNEFILLRIKQYSEYLFCIFFVNHMYGNICLGARLTF
jgi:hypothetical protein